MSRRLFRILLRFYPRSYRERDGAELMSFWARQSAEPRYAGRPGRLKLVLHLLVDAAAGGLRCRLRALWRAGVRGEAGRGEGLRGMWQDAGYAVRSIRGAPLHALVVVLTLGLGIGATTAIFGVVDAVLLRPLPYAEAGDLVFVSRVRNGVASNISWPDFRDWREQAAGFSGMAAYYETDADFRWSDGAEQLTGAGATRDLFEVLGVAPLLGRTFTAAEDRLGGTDAIILSWGLWQRRFGGDPGAVGSLVTVAGQPVEIVGVMPRGFAFPTERTEFWQPAQDDELLGRAGLPTGSRGLVFLDVVGRLDGPIERARVELSALATRIWDEAGIPPERRLPVEVESLHRQVVGDVRLTLFMLLGAVSLVLLVACANVASLSLSRATARTQELAVRVALGAGRGRLVRQMLTESLVLAAAAGVLGVGVAWGMTRAVVAAAPAGVPRLGSVTTGAGSLAFAAATAILAGLLFGIAPALRSTGGRIADGLARRGRGSLADRRSLRPQQLLVVFQVSLSVALLVGAMLLVRSYSRLLSVEPGYATDGIVMAAVAPPEDRYADPAAIDGFYTTLLERVQALPGVVAATTTYSPPLTDNGFSTTIEIEGEPENPDDRIWAGSVVVREGYFETTGTELLLGRDFDATDRLGGEPVAIVNQTMAARFWPGQNPIGKRFRMTSGVLGSIGTYDQRFFPRDWLTVVGVAGDVRRESLDSPPGIEYYRPHRQVVWAFEYLLVRTTGTAGASGEQIRETVRSIDAAVPVESIQTVKTVVRDATAEWRFRMLLLSAFAVTTCVLAMLGVYAVMALAVARRRREMGVRLALGATAPGLQVRVLRGGLGLVGAGAVIGLALSAVGNRVLESMLFEVAPSDLTTYVAVTAATAAVALLACWIPARQASRIDPVRSLQQE